MHARGANTSNLFAQIFNPYGVTLPEFAQINDYLFTHVYKALESKKFQIPQI